ncbi:hypothetical protein GJ496_010904 [Pomphorhynchus laevis]|nr:hypothetical protein GJ496_010904 [Pomphorhynchus laevis]KAI0989540.1 hypothetical protein GJ496_010904 [Pomphorhynchus laevis]
MAIESNQDLIKIPQHWKDTPVSQSENPKGTVCESSFAVLFPKYREKYIKECWTLVKDALKPYGITGVLDLIEGTMQVKTTRKTFDPYAIINARDVIKLISRNVPYQQALKVMDEAFMCDIVKISSFVRNKERFVKRRRRLIGTEGQTLKALELLTKCYILVQGHTVCIIGSYKGIRQARKVVEDCMKNIHPIYSIKTLMIARELEQDPELKNESWTRFLPSFKASTKQRKKKNIKWRPKRSAIFPPEQTPRKVDIELETGEFFMNQEMRRQAERQKKLQKQSLNTRKRKLEREKAFIPPKENKFVQKDKNQSESYDLSNVKRRLNLSKNQN